MNSRWGTAVSVALVVNIGLVMAWQFLHRADKKGTVVLSAIVQSCLRGEKLANIHSIADRDREVSEASASDRYIDLMLPEDTRVFMTGMTGPTNHDKIGCYSYMIYYVFPRQIDVSVEQPTRITKDGFSGRTIESDQEIFARGYGMRVAVRPGNVLACEMHPELHLREVRNPDWFDSNIDMIVAFLLPLLTALAGMWLFRFLFPGLSRELPLIEQLAYALGLGMMAVAALTLGVKLCGFHGYRLVFLATAAGSAAEAWRDRKIFWRGISAGCRQMVHRPVALALLTSGLLVFLILFRLAGLQGLVEFDAVMAWSLKAKIIHRYTGNELVQWFSNPRLTEAHLDYPTLVPSLHAATYDSLGHVDEFVTKFWPAWMLLLLMAALASLYRDVKSRFEVPGIALLSLLLLPATQRYAQMEGGTLPMIFFTVLGFVQCGLWLVTRDRSRLGLGMILLFGAAMAKFEGFIFLALAASWMLALPSARPPLKPSPSAWRVLAFCLLAALPFIWLRVRIPTLHFESGWAGYALHHPGSTLPNWPRLFLILLARLFVAPDFARWNGETGQLQWIGQWDGPSSLFNQTTLGLGWLCLFLTIALWFAVPARRQVVVWTLAMLVGALAAFSLVFASFVNATSLAHVIGYTADEVAGRYLLPVLLAWFTTILTMLFAEQPSSTIPAGRKATFPRLPPAADLRADRKARLKQGQP
jgi:hypothetical protein